MILISFRRWLLDIKDLKTMAFLCDTGRRKLGAFLVVLVVVEIFFICLMVRHEHKSAITHALLRQEMEVRRVTPRGIDGMWKWRRDEQMEREKLSVFRILVHCTSRACGKWMHHISQNCRACLEGKSEQVTFQVNHLYDACTCTFSK